MLTPHSRRVKATSLQWSSLLRLPPAISLKLSAPTSYPSLLTDPPTYLAFSSSGISHLLLLLPETLFPMDALDCLPPSLICPEVTFICPEAKPSLMLLLKLHLLPFSLTLRVLLPFPCHLILYCIIPISYVCFLSFSARK